MAYDTYLAMSKKMKLIFVLVATFGQMRTRPIYIHSQTAVAETSAVKNLNSKKEQQTVNTNKNSLNATMDSILKKYRMAPLMKMQVIKKVKSELLVKEQKHEGTIYFSKGKMRWENEKPEKNLLVFDGLYVWNLQNLEDKKNIQILKSKISKTAGSNLLVDYLNGKNVLDKNFKLNSKKNVDDIFIAEFSSIKKNSSIKEITIQMDQRKKLIQELSYKDDVGNITTLIFTNVEFLNKQNSVLFQVKIPKGAKVTYL